MTLHYRTSNSGNGKPIVLIHGFCENSTCFAQVLSFLDGHNVITIDLPGHGQSPVNASFSMDELAGEIKQVLDKEQVSQAVMVGHSMGGYATLAFAKRYPEMLKGFGLFHSSAGADNDERKAKRDQAIRVIREKGAEAYITGFVPPMFAPGTDKTLVEERLAENRGIPAEALTGCLKAMKERPDSKSFLEQTDLPVLFVVGKQDGLIPEKDMIAQAALCKQAQVVYLEHSGHMGMLEEAEKAGEGLRTFADLCFNQ
jgi:pimeloyl-ACP methyl ester carboxylesterase